MDLVPLNSGFLTITLWVQLVKVKVELVIYSPDWNTPVTGPANNHLRPELTPNAWNNAPDVIPLIWSPITNKPVDLSL